MAEIQKGMEDCYPMLKKLLIFKLFCQYFKNLYF